MASIEETQAAVDRSRADLAATLNELEDKLNVPKQLGIKAREAKASYDKKPLPWLAGIGSAAVVVGGLALLGLRRR